MARIKVDASKLEVVAPKFMIDAFDEKSLIIIADTITAEMHTLITGFPEHKWRRVDAQTAGFVVPATKSTLDYLQRTWMKSEYTVSETANTLMMYEDISARVDEAKAKRRWEYLFEDKDTAFNYPYKRKPFMHQSVAIEAAYGAEYFGHLMEMGTGKTKCIADEIGIYLSKLKGNEMFKCVIVCPKSLMTNWERELHVNIDTGLFHTTIVQLKGELTGLDSIAAAYRDPTNVKIFIVSYDSCGAMLDALRMIKPTMLVCDESQYIKNPESKRFKYVRKIAEVSTMRRILTGSPVSNNITDLFSQFEILRPGALGYNTYAGFKRAFCTIDESGQFEKITGYHDIDKLKQNMARMSFIVRKDQCLDLPDKMYEVRYIDMPQKMKEVYAEFASSFFVELDNGMEISTEHVIVQMLRLSQICCGFTGAKEKYMKMLPNGDGDDTKEELERNVITEIPDGDTKMVQMLEDAVDLVESGSKLIIWSRFRYDNKRMSKRLTDLGIWNGVYDGGANDKDRQDMVDAFNTDNDFKVMIANTGSGGVGLTLLGTKASPCHTAYFYSNDFSYGKRQQAEARNHRIGQVNKVLYRDYVYKDSIEEYISGILNKKRDLSDMVKDVAQLKEYLLKVVA